MAFDTDDFYRERSRLESAGGGAVRVVLLFGSAAIALGLIAVQVLDSRLTTQFADSTGSPGIDYTSTGTIGYKGTYTIRRSVLQASPNSICVLRDNGTRSGDC